MDEEDRYSASSAESERENENDNDNTNDNDEVMEDADDGDNEVDPEDDNHDEDEDDEGDNDDNDNENEDDNDADRPPEPVKAESIRVAQTTGNRETQDNAADSQQGREDQDGEDQDGERADDEDEEEEDNDDEEDTEQPQRKSATPKPPVPRRPVLRPEAISARLYDIVPTMAAPQNTSVNAIAITPDLRYWFTGGSDGYIRKYDGPGTINGKLALTVAQRHPYVDSVTKAGILMSYWENEEPAPPGRGDQEHLQSVVYSLAVHSEALWLLSGLESGGINLQSVRHDEGKRICCLQRHSNAVSVLTLAQDEKSVLSGSWDKNIFDWDLNNGQIKRSFDGIGGQISSIELRPASGAPVPADAEGPVISDTISTNNGMPFVNGDSRHGQGNSGGAGKGTKGDGKGSPDNESLFGGSDAGSLFGESAGEQPFGHDEDEFGSSMMPGHGHESGMDHSADMAMAGIESGRDGPSRTTTAPAGQQAAAPASGGDAMDLDRPSSSQGAQGPTTQSTAAGTSQLDSEHIKFQVKQENNQTQSQNGTSSTGQPSTQSPSLLMTSQPQTQLDPSETSTTTFLSAAMDGSIRVWDRRVQNPVARIGNRLGVPPWCMSACWSPDGNMIYAGRRNGTVEEFDVRKAKRGWEPERVLRFPGGSGAVSAVKPMANGRHLVCASHDIMRLYDLRETRLSKQSPVPFLIIPGPPRAGVIASLYIDPTSRYMLSAAGTRGWEGTSTETLLGYEINVVD